MPSSRTQVRAEAPPRRDRILAETLRIVGERGYHGFGIQELAARSGLTKPGLLHHFGTKDQLLIALLNEVEAKDQAELAEAFGPDFDRAGTAEAHRQMFWRSMRAILQLSLSRPELIRLRVVLRVEAINPDHPAHGYFLARNKAALERLSRRAATFSPHPQSTARQVMALISGLEEQWLRENGGFDLVAEWDRAAETILGAGVVAADRD